ncbi:PAS domain-containing protein [Luteibacter sp. HA06]
MRLDKIRTTESDLIREALKLERHVLADASRGLIVSDIQGTLVFANTLATDILGHVRIGAGIDDYSCMHGLFMEDGRPYPADDLPLARAVLCRDVLRDVRLLVRRPDGQYRLLSIDAEPVFSATGKAVGAAAMFRVIEAEAAGAD